MNSFIAFPPERQRLFHNETQGRRGLSAIAILKDSSTEGSQSLAR
jgi:hypothetical protein